jgi:uncharacterized protein YigE (DUF2233 family)
MVSIQFYLTAKGEGVKKSGLITYLIKSGLIRFNHFNCWIRSPDYFDLHTHLSSCANQKSLHSIPGQLI